MLLLIKIQSMFYNFCCTKTVKSKVPEASSSRSELISAGPYKFEFIKRVIGAVENRTLVGNIEDLREWCPFKFGLINDKNLELATLSWGYFLGVLIAYRDILDFDFRKTVDRATEYYNLAASSSYEQIIRDCVRSSIPEIESAFRKLRQRYLR